MLAALGKIGVMSQSIRDCVLWAFRYEKVSGVRAEACHSIITLHMTDKEVIQWLQDRYLVEPSDIVKEWVSSFYCIVGSLVVADRVDYEGLFL